MLFCDCRCIFPILKITCTAIIAFILFSCAHLNASEKSASVLYNSDDVETLAQDLLFAVKVGEPADELVEQVASLTQAQLSASLDTHNKKLAFWLNLYNAFVQLQLKNNPELYKSRSAFFTCKTISVAGQKMSLDDIEHGMLRKSRIKWSLGKLGKPFPRKFERLNRLNKIDWRIHFALNCGAKSCPPIAFYESEKIDEQLDLATTNFLGQEVIYKADEKTAYLPTPMSWFRADFNGKKGMHETLLKEKLIPADQKTKLKFKPYNWGAFYRQLHKLK